jgi:hypothetical protein
MSQKIIGEFTETGIPAGRFEHFVVFNGNIPHDDQLTYQWPNSTNFGQSKRVRTRRDFTSLSCNGIAESSVLAQKFVSNSVHVIFLSINLQFQHVLCGLDPNFLANVFNHRSTHNCSCSCPKLDIPTHNF